MSGKPSGNLKSSVRLSFLSTVFAGVLQFLGMMVLARLLSPVDYGVFALCTAIASLSPVFVTNVIERVLVVTPVQGEERDKTLPIALLCLLATAVALLICFPVNYFGLVKINLTVLALVCLNSILFTSAMISPRVALRRDIRFGPIVIAETSGVLFGQLLTAIVFAWAGWGAYALVAAGFVQNIVTLTLLRWKTRRQRLDPPTPASMAALLRSAAALGGNAATELVNSQVSPIVLGTRLGPAALGLFNRSYSLVQMPIQLLVSSMARVMISALFSVSEDPVRLRGMARSLVRVSAAMATPVAAGIAGASHNFVLFAFGARWLAAQSIMPLLAIGAWGVMMGTLFGIIAESMRAFNDKTRNQTISTTCLIALSLAGATIGLFWAVAGIALSGCIFLLLFSRLAARLLELPVLRVLGWLAPGLVIGAPCLAISLVLGHVMSGPPTAVFVAQIAGCGAVDVAAMLLLYPALTLQIINGMAPRLLRLFPSLARYLDRGAKIQAA